MSNVWKRIQEKKRKISKHMQKKHNDILVPSQRYQDSRHLLQNPTFPYYVMGFSNRAQRFTGSNLRQNRVKIQKDPKSEGKKVKK